MREKTRVDTIYETLRDRICLGQYQPGDVFFEGALGLEFQVSRTPIRQVLQRLAFERLAVVRTGVGTIVEDFTRQDTKTYLEMHSRILATVAELDLVGRSLDYQEAVAHLRVRSMLLGPDVDRERFWLYSKAVQEISSSLVADDLVRHMNELLFYRSGPALMAGVQIAPELASRIFQSGSERLLVALEASDAPAFFLAESRNLQDCKALIAPS